MAFKNTARIGAFTCVLAALTLGCASPETTAPSGPVVVYHAVRSGADWIDARADRQTSFASARVTAPTLPAMAGLAQEVEAQRLQSGPDLAVLPTKAAIFEEANSDPAFPLPQDRAKKEVFEASEERRPEAPAPLPLPVPASVVALPAATPDRSEVAQAIVRRSIARYGGSCPCPYNTDRAGRSCGARSAWSRPGGESPLCYEGDVTAGMIAGFRD